jgi:hypothetical protein
VTLLGALLLILLSCLNQNVALDAPTRRAVSPVIHVVADSTGAAAALSLGWRTGIPGALVVIRQSGEMTAVVDSGITNLGGYRDLSSLAAGSYTVSVVRLLTGSDRASLAPDESVEAFALEADLPVGSADTITVAVLPAVRGSLLTNEWSFTPGYYGQYPYKTGGFWELYNNADTTLYLDGLILGEGFLQTIETIRSCSTAASEFLASDGVWVAQLNQFPGTGYDYPVLPGHAVVVATDAIDHSSLFKNALDLRSANFEFTGPADVDNPDVPNLIWLGPGQSIDGHGESFFSLGGVPVVARRLDTAMLARKADGFGNTYWKVPAGDLIDVAALRYYDTFGHPKCPALVNPAISLDVSDGGYGPDPFLVSQHRRVLYSRSDGQMVLLNTRSSRTNFIDGARTPGIIP